jgi:hypothetical protein
MPLPTASDILRRIQDSIYLSFTPLFPEVADDDFYDSDSLHRNIPEDNDAHPSLSETEHEPQSLQFENFPRPNSPSSVPSPPVGALLALSLSASDSAPQEIDNGSTSTRRRQSSIQGPSASDVDTQALLRKRIRDIQQLDLHEREKARRVQVPLSASPAP